MASQLNPNRPQQHRVNLPTSSAVALLADSSRDHGAANCARNDVLGFALSVVESASAVRTPEAAHDDHYAQLAQSVGRAANAGDAAASASPCQRGVRRLVPCRGLAGKVYRPQRPRRPLRLRQIRLVLRRPGEDHIRAGQRPVVVVRKTPPPAPRRASAHAGSAARPTQGARGATHTPAPRPQTAPDSGSTAAAATCPPDRPTAPRDTAPRVQGMTRHAQLGGRLTDSRSVWHRHDSSIPLLDERQCHQRQPRPPAAKRESRSRALSSINRGNRVKDHPRHDSPPTAPRLAARAGSRRRRAGDAAGLISARSTRSSCAATSWSGRSPSSFRSHPTRRRSPGSGACAGSTPSAPWGLPPRGAARHWPCRRRKR
jgi:hypothetical protein